MVTLRLTYDQLSALYQALRCADSECALDQTGMELMKTIYEIEEDEPNDFLDSYDRAKEFLEPLRCQQDAEDFVRAMDDIMGHAMDMYISDAEDLGCEIVQNAEVIEERSYFRGRKDQLHEDMQALSDANMPAGVSVLQDHDEASDNICYI